jgi:hypothetical protein
MEFRLTHVSLQIKYLKIEFQAGANYIDICPSSFGPVCLPSIEDVAFNIL